MPRREFGTCSRCEQWRRIAVTSKGWCSACYWEVSPRVVCGGCGSRKRRAAVHEGVELCRDCWRERKPHETCDGCGLERFIASRRTGDSLCATCWVRVRPPSTCEACGRSTQKRRRHGTAGMLCPRCFEARKSPEVCGGCGRLMRVHGRAPDGSARCGTCSGKARPPEPCGRCGRVAVVAARRDDGPRCQGCWQYERSGRRCGCAAPVVIDRACILCAANRAGRTVLADALRAWLTTGNRHGKRQWLRTRPGGHILRAMLRGEVGVDHESLTECGPARVVVTVRALLVDLGVLDPRDERIAAVQTAVDSAVREAASGDAAVLTRFGRWVVLRGVAVRIERGAARLGTPRTAKAKIRRIASLLADLRQDGVALTDVDQPWIDEWVAAHRSARPDVRSFLRWARSQGLVTGPVDVDPATSAEVRVEVDEEERRALLTRFLHDETIETRDRAAGFLLAGLGQPLTRIVVLTVDHVPTGRPTRLLLGTSPLQMPPPLDALVEELVTEAGARSRPWLFPGQAAHMSANHLASRLARLGVTNVVAIRNAAWAALAVDTPAVVLAEKLGASVSAAERWSQAVAAGRSDYAALVVGDGQVP